MPIPHGMRHVNKVALNKVILKVSLWLQGLAVVVHRGHKSGKQYHTRVKVFSRPDNISLLSVTSGTTTDRVM